MNPELYRLGARIGGREYGDLRVCEVYLAEHVDIPRSIVLKAWPWMKDLPDLEIDRAAVREVLSLRDEHLAQVYDYGIIGPLGPYVAMEHVEGHSLDVLARDDRISLRQKLQIASDAARGLAVMHAKGVAHGQVRPWKIRRVGLSVDDGPYRGSVQTTARLLDLLPPPRTNHSLTGPIETRGLEYLSPERIRGPRRRAVSDDLFALAAIVFEIVTGEPPQKFTGGTLEWYVRRSRTEAPDPVEVASANGRTCPAGLDDILRKALKLDPSKRYQTALELASAIDQ